MTNTGKEMTSHSWLIASCVVLFALGSASLSQPTAQTLPRVAGGQDDAVHIRPGYVAIKFKSIGSSKREATPASLSSLTQYGIQSLEPLFRQTRPIAVSKEIPGRTDLSRIFLATIPLDLDPLLVAEEIGRRPDVEYAEPRYLYRILDTPNDSLLHWQDPYFTRMNVYNGWSSAKGDSSVIIATVDGGTYWEHEDLLPNLWVNPGEDINHNGRFDRGPPPRGDEDGIDNDGNYYVDDVIGWNFTDNSNNPKGFENLPKNFGHGTTTASLFGAATNNMTGIAGTSWNCRLMPICASDATMDTHLFSVDQAIQYASANGASVINCSWGGDNTPSRTLEDVIDAATENGSLVIVAAGNGNSNNDVTPFYPAGYRNVLAVGGTNSVDDGKAEFSNYGATVPVFAPSVDIFSVMIDGSYWNAGKGTSYSSPLVAGLAGLLKSLHPAWKPSQILAQIHVTADPIDAVASNGVFSGKLGHGRVNFGRALSENNHPGIQIVESSFRVGWRTRFYSGDTVTLTLTVKNVLFVPAVNLQFSASSTEAKVEVLKGTEAPITLQPGEQFDLPGFILKIGNISQRDTVAIRIDWVSNGNEQDATSCRLLIDSPRPAWMPQANTGSVELRSVKAVGQAVAWAAGGNSSPAVLRTVNGGLTWLNVTGDLQVGMPTTVEATDSFHAWVGDDSGRIAATTDGGKKWTVRTYDGAQASCICGIKFFDSDNGLALGNPPRFSTQFVILKTTDGGSTWVHLPSEPVGNIVGEVGGPNSFCWIDSKHGWFGTNQCRIFRTADPEKPWTSAPTWKWVDPPPVEKVFSVAFADSLNGLAYHPYPWLVRTTDGGENWNIQVSPLPQSSSEAHVAYQQDSSRVWVAVGKSIAYSGDRGVTWKPQSTYPILGDIRHISIASGKGNKTNYTGWAVTSAGEILKIEDVVAGVADREWELPRAFRLEQNYPNPFNPRTVVRSSIPPQAGRDPVSTSGRDGQTPEVSNVRIMIYDVLGREVKVLVNERRAAGSYEDSFDASGLASGVYIYRLTAGSFAQARKMILMK